MKLPARNPDLRRYVRARYIKLFTALILWNALLAWLEYIFIYDYFITTLNELNAEGFPHLPGQRVRHYRGTRFPLILDYEHELCVICGANNGKDADVCAYCGRTLVKPR